MTRGITLERVEIIRVASERYPDDDEKAEAYATRMLRLLDPSPFEQTVIKAAPNLAATFRKKMEKDEPATPDVTQDPLKVAETKASEPEASKHDEVFEAPAENGALDDPEPQKPAEEPLAEPETPPLAGQIQEASEREAVKQLLAEGKNNAQIAIALKIGMDKVSRHRKALGMAGRRASPDQTAEREQAIKALFEAGKSDEEIADQVDVSVVRLKTIRRKMKLNRKRGGNRAGQKRKQERIAAIKRMIVEGKTNPEMMEALGCSMGSITNYRKELGMPGSTSDRSMSWNRALPKRKDEVRAKRRFTETKPLDPEGVRGLDDDHLAMTAMRTLFPGRLVSPLESKNLLVGGENSRKIGSHVTKGPWKGFPIFTLMLEERATCPDTCHMLATCYGNGMQFARRHEHGPMLEVGLQRELRALQNEHPDGFVVRLHILGDFYSVEYVELWREWLKEFPALHVFGYTARTRTSEIGAAVKSLTDSNWERFAIRFSSPDSKPQGATTIDYIPETPVVPAGIVCPSQTGGTDCCGTCGLCWHPAARQKTIAFVLHGNTKTGRKPKPQKPVQKKPSLRLVSPATTGSSRRGRPPKLEMAPNVKRLPREDEEAAIQAFLENNGGARRFEPGQVDVLAKASLEDEGYEVVVTGGKHRHRTPWSVDGKKLTQVQFIEMANEYRMAHGLEPFTIPREGEDH